eukprot:1355754-Rhodomonas_salina.3
MDAFNEEHGARGGAVVTIVPVPEVQHAVDVDSGQRFEHPSPLDHDVVCAQSVRCIGSRIKVDAAVDPLEDLFSVLGSILARRGTVIVLAEEARHATGSREALWARGLADAGVNRDICPEQLERGFPRQKNLE